MTAARIENVSQANEDPFAALSSILTSYNEHHVGSAAGHAPLWLFARDDQGHVIGGLRGYSFWSWAFVDTLAVADTHRKAGIGSALLREAETIARARGCIGIYLWTTSFQGPDFYPRHGYQVFGTLADLPPGHTAQWFMKRFTASPATVDGPLP